jgi:hypothetical protein
VLLLLRECVQASMQAAMAGFNGGNSTGWYALPYSGHGRIWQLAFFSNVLESGRIGGRVCTRHTTRYRSMDFPN